MKITARLLVGFGAMVLLVLALSYGALSTVSSLGAALDASVNQGARRVQLMGNIHTGFERLRAEAGKVEMSSVNMLIGQLESDHAAAEPPCSSCHTQSEVSVQKQHFDEAGVALKARIAELRPLTATGETGMLDQIDRGVSNWEELYQEYLGLIWKRRFADAHDIMLQKIYPLMADLDKSADQLADGQQSQMKDAISAAKSTQQSGRTVAFVLIVLCLAAGGAVHWTLRNISRVLRRFLGEVTEVTIQVAAGASQVSTSAQSVARGASTQAASLEETASSSAGVHTLAQNSAEKSRTAARQMDEAASRVDQANQALFHMMTTMNAINASSDKIAKIVKAIDGVAFQTNILALNAAVEAARAGDAGLGFAVVADEVRSLARRCSEAAGETAALIEESIAMSHEGKSKFDEVTAAIQSITSTSGKAKGLVDELSATSQEQMNEVGQVSHAVARMESVTREAAASAVESAAAAESLHMQSQKLKQLVEQLAATI